MRRRQVGHSLRWLLLGSLLVAAAVSCTPGAEDLEDRGAEHMSSDSAELEQAASLAVSAGAKLDRQQLVQLLGDRVPAAAGGACTNLGQVCAPQSFAATTACGGFSDTCDSTGTQNGVFVDFICLNLGGSATCTAIAEQTVVTQSCSRATNGNSCGGGCGAAFCLSYSTTCSEQTTQVQSCLSAGVCSNDVCTGQTSFQQAIGTCQRDTDGDRCSRSCSGTATPQCNNGACQCLSGQP